MELLEVQETVVTLTFVISNSNSRHRAKSNGEDIL